MKEHTVFDFALFDRVNTSDPEEKCFSLQKSNFYLLLYAYMEACCVHYIKSEFIKHKQDIKRRSFIDLCFVHDKKLL